MEQTDKPKSAPQNAVSDPGLHWLTLIQVILDTSSERKNGLVQIITKARLFKYIENFTTKKWKLSSEKFW